MFIKLLAWSQHSPVSAGFLGKVRHKFVHHLRNCDRRQIQTEQEGPGTSRSGTPPATVSPVRFTTSKGLVLSETASTLGTGLIMLTCSGNWLVPQLFSFGTHLASQSPMMATWISTGHVYYTTYYSSLIDQSCVSCATIKMQPLTPTLTSCTDILHCGKSRRLEIRSPSWMWNKQLLTSSEPPHRAKPLRIPEEPHVEMMRSLYVCTQNSLLVCIFPNK